MRSDSSIAEYQSRCREIILLAIERPKTIYRKLIELEACLFGHARAHEQMGLIERTDYFQHQFSDWIFANYEVSCSTGWADACRRAAKRSTTPEKLFEKWALEFLPQWGIRSEQK